jgi:hypothetical protein
MEDHRPDMLHRGIRLAVLPLLVGLLYACNADCITDKDRLFLEMFPTYDFTDELHVELAIDEFPRVELDVQNRSAEYLLFGPNLGVRAFYFDETTCQWEELENSYIVHPETGIVIGPIYDRDHYLGVASFNPAGEISNQLKGYRILIAGKRIRGDVLSEEIMATFIDVSD